MDSLEGITPDVRDELARLMRDLSENPETREAALRLTKKVRPSMSIDAIELKDHMNGQLEQANQRVQLLEQQLRERELKEELGQKRQSLVNRGKVSSLEEVAEVEKVMLEKRIADHDTAAEYYSYMKEAAKPTPSSFSSRNVMNETNRDMLSKFWKDPAGAARDEAAKAMMDLRRGTVKAIGI